MGLNLVKKVRIKKTARFIRRTFLASNNKPDRRSRARRRRSCNSWKTYKESKTSLICISPSYLELECLKVYPTAHITKVLVPDRNNYKAFRNGAWDGYAILVTFQTLIDFNAFRNTIWNMKIYGR